MNIKVVRLISGEELLGEWDSENFKISNPVVMVPVTTVSYTHLTLPTKA